MYPSKGMFVYLNGMHFTSLDVFFINYTLLGDGIFSVFVFFILLSQQQFTKGLHVIGAYIISGVTVQVLKNAVGAPRPKLVFAPEEYANFVQGITLSGSNGFPSGHTTSAFALFTLLAIYSHNKWLGAVYMFLAVTVGYSRIYLGQHFFHDVVVGSLIGTATAVLCYLYLPQVELRIGSYENKLE